MPGHVVFQWGPTDPFNYDNFIVRWTINQGAAQQDDIDGGGREAPTYEAKATRAAGTFTLSLKDTDSVWFIVEGAESRNVQLHSKARLVVAGMGWQSARRSGSKTADNLRNIDRAKCLKRVYCCRFGL